MPRGNDAANISSPECEPAHTHPCWRTGIIMTPQGRWLQTLGIIAGIGLPLLLAIGAGIWTISSSIASNHITELSAINDMQKEYMQSNSNLATRVAIDEQRIDALAQTDSQHYAELTAFMSEVRSGLQSISNQLSDLKVSEAGKQPLHIR
jgi:hypothetical protein